ncbi:lytic transglycosylase domain-containing protein [Dyella silvatica]|uniref:lytic transglycosylase domain-containing protein n=1 Tax=Dyella silvatica TaxID=2992128 RepID=UPI002B1CB243|nr:lytic transglycosylase domain-containing protein [Dyella silvatica]
MEMMACPNLAVPAEVMQHIVNVESGENPYAIGVVGGQLVRQPLNLDEAIATVRMLESKGYNFSVGLAQVNRANLGKYGLDTYEKAFQTCSNLAAGARILAECYASSGGDWGKSFSCYYSGNFTTGYRDGYVQKIYDSINRSASNQSAAIPIQLISNQAVTSNGIKGMAPVAADSAAYRVAIRSVLLDTAASMAVVPAAAKALGTTPAQVMAPPTAVAAEAPPVATMQAQAQAVMAAAMNAQTVAPTAVAPSAAVDTNNGIFVPQVHGPGESVSPTASTDTVAPQVAALPTVSTPATDQADLRQGNRDDAFVF